MKVIAYDKNSKQGKSPFISLTMTTGRCHCEERSDEAIPLLAGRLLSPRPARDMRFARNDRMERSLCSQWQHGAVASPMRTKTKEMFLNFADKRL